MVFALEAVTLPVHYGLYLKMWRWSLWASAVRGKRRLEELRFEELRLNIYFETLYFPLREASACSSADTMKVVHTP